MTTYKKTTSESGILADGRYVPPDPANVDYAAYQAAVLDGVDGTQDADFVLADAKASAKATVELAAEAERSATLATIPGAATVFAMAVAEAKVASGDGDIQAGEYPVLESLVPAKGANVAAVATAILAERTALLGIEAVAAATKDTIDSQTNKTGIDGALDAIVWP